MVLSFLSDLETFARNIARKNNVLVIEYNEKLSGRVISPTYKGRLLSVPLENRSLPYADAHQLNREIRVPSFGTYYSDHETLAMWLHELGHVLSFSQSFYWSGYLWGPTYSIREKFRVKLEEDAWRWAEKQFEFNSEMLIVKHFALNSYYAYRDRIEYVKLDL